MKHAAIENFIKYVIQPMGVAAFAILAGLVVTVAMEAGAENTVNAHDFLEALIALFGWVSGVVTVVTIALAWHRGRGRKAGGEPA
jgi:hypothetical protein